MPAFKDENILIIVPGSQTTLAQLGLPESFTAPSHRFPTRMFRAPGGKTWEPYRICERAKLSTDGDVAMSGMAEKQEIELVEFPDEDEEAVWPLKEGRIENLPAFLALLQHIHTAFSPTLNTPVLLVGQPSWTAKNHEDITQFVFEKFKTPGLCILDSAIAASYAYGVANATVIDVGFEKTDVTAITDFVISARGTVRENGGEAMTRRLMELLKKQGFTKDMAEQLKKSPICEILPPGIPMPTPGTVESTTQEEDLNCKSNDVPSFEVALSNDDIKKPATMIEKIDDKLIEDEGVLDIAAIVTSGKTQEILAKREKEKAERAAARRANRDAEKGESTTAASKPVKLPNSNKPRAVFHYEEYIENVPSISLQKTPESQILNATTSNEVNPNEATNNFVSDETVTSTQDDTTRKDQPKTVRKEEKKKVKEEENPHRIRRDIEVGIERFQAADNGYMDAIADTVYRTILSIDEIAKRNDVWESLIICGSGSKVRGFKDALLGILNNRYLVTPSSAPTFVGELPSNIGTPRGTPSGAGAMTPSITFPSSLAPPMAGVVNPHFPITPSTMMIGNNVNNPNANMTSTGVAVAAAHNRPSRSQTPTSIKLANPPSYFPEWKQFDEAIFLGSQVAAKVFFINDQGQSKAFLSRTEFNDDGPTAIHQVGLVY